MEHIEFQPDKKTKLPQPFTPRVEFPLFRFVPFPCLPVHSSSPPPPPRPPPTPSADMLLSIAAVENILRYKFRNARLLEDALTHPSYAESASYERLEFLGDGVLNIVVSYHVFSTYPDADQGVLSSLRSVIVSTENLARVAVRHAMHRFFRHNVSGLDSKIKQFENAVKDEEDSVIYGGLVKAPKVLADIVESVAAAVYVDLNCDQLKLWMILKPLMEPLVTPEDLHPQPQPVTMLYEICNKNGKDVDIKYWRKGDKSMASVYVDSSFVASGSSNQKELAKLNAAKAALAKLSHLEEALKRGGNEDYRNGPFDIEAAKQRLHEICGKRKWPKPEYSTVKDSGPPHAKKYVCSVKVPTPNGTYCIDGEEKSRIKDAQNSASSLMIRALEEQNII